MSGWMYPAEHPHIDIIDEVNDSRGSQGPMEADQGAGPGNRFSRTFNLRSLMILTFDMERFSILGIVLDLNL